MGTFLKTVHVIETHDLYEFLASIKCDNQTHSPFQRILFKLFRRGYLKTILIEQAPTESQYLDEAEYWQETDVDLFRYHFFRCEAEALKNVDYGGYVDLRPGTHSIAEAFITENIFSSGAKDTYAFIPCKMMKGVEIPTATGSLGAEIKGFPFYEKNNKEMMCAQAAVLSIVDYWKHKNPEFFKNINSAADINESLAISKTTIEQYIAKAGGRGLNLIEMATFFQNHGFTCICRNFSGHTIEGIKKSNITTDVYSYIESRLPVLAGVKTSHGILHALAFIGHTFDKNSWQAMADVGYYGKEVLYAYHDNTAWIENLIIQDDNFGPYNFFSLKRLEEILLYVIIPVPMKGIDVFPHEAARVAATGLLSSEACEKILPQLVDDLEKLSDEKSRNHASYWLKAFLNHRTPQCGDGLVLRTVLRQGSEIINAYKKHAFEAPISDFLSDKKEKWFWIVELSWPDIYCFDQKRCGMVLVDTSYGIDPNGNKKCYVHMTHIPGYLFINHQKGINSRFRTTVDCPQGHFKPSSLA